MTKIDKTNIFEKVKDIVALNGIQGMNMRNLAEQIDISPSVFYHHFRDKDDLMKQMFDYISLDLGRKRRLLSDNKPFEKLLEERILFQLENAAAVTAILKYFLHYRSNFPQVPDGFVPKTAYLHIKEILELGVSRNEIDKIEIDKTAKIMTHAINGFVLEYFPATVSIAHKKRITGDLVSFFMKSLRREVKI